MADAKRNLVTVPLNKNNSFPHRIDGIFGAAKVGWGAGEGGAGEQGQGGWRARPGMAQPSLVPSTRLCMQTMLCAGLAPTHASCLLAGQVCKQLGPCAEPLLRFPAANTHCCCRSCCGQLRRVLV